MAKAPLKKKVTAPTRSAQEVVTELDNLKQNKKLIEKRETELKKELTSILEREGAKDDKGNIKLVVGDKLAQIQARKSVKLNKDRAEEFFRAKGLWAEVIDTVEVINEGYVEQALLNEKFSMQELEEITDVKVVPALVLSNYKPEEVEEE